MLNQEAKKQVPKRGLGRGLASLLPSAFSDEIAGRNPDIVSTSPNLAVENVISKSADTPAFAAAGTKNTQPYFFCHVDDIVPNPNQPRKHFDENALKELTQSIQTHGILSPIVVRQRGAHYEIVAGERRWRASKMAGLTKVPVLLKDVGDKAQYQLALVENIQRHNLTPIEEAIGYQHLMEAYGWTQEKVADQIGKDRSTIANALRLLKLPQSIQDLINTEKISSGHAKALLALESEEEVKKLAKKIVEEGWSVRSIEKEVKHTKRPAKLAMEKRESIFVRELEKKLESVLRLKVHIEDFGNKGQMKIHYTSSSELNRIAEKLGAI